jgi:hypothetical protein
MTSLMLLTEGLDGEGDSAYEGLDHGQNSKFAREAVLEVVEDD